MDNFNDSNFLNQDSAAPIPFDEGGADESGISHAPLDLGGGPSSAPKPAAPKPAESTTQTPKIEAPKPFKQKSTEKAASSDRITGVKTFFTKLHPGAMNFLDEQIGDWLKENPDVRIKRTNIATGEVQAKKTEPNILITVWY